MRQHWVFFRVTDRPERTKGAEIYTEDPDGIAVEFAVLTRELDAQDASQALELLRSPSPARSGAPKRVQLHKAQVRA